jgi:tetratricopeptide (TPR) repeat protein
LARRGITLVVDVSKYIERAESDLKRRNWDAAITQFDQILKISPDCAEARLGLRQASRKKFEKRYPSALERTVLNLPTTLLAAVAGLVKAKAWHAQLLEQSLRRDPSNAALNHRLGLLLQDLGHSRGAAASFQLATEADGNAIESWKRLGELLAERKEFERAIECFERAMRINPRDQEAARMQKNLAAEGAIRQGGFEQATSARDLAKSERQLKEAERVQKIVRTADDINSALEDLAADLEQQPKDTKLLLRRVILLQQKQDFEAALAAAEALLEVDPSHAEAQDHRGELKQRQLERELKLAEEEARAGEDGADDRARRLKRELRTFRLGECRRRVAAQPTDMQARFRLGRALLEEGTVDEAIEQFQQAIRDPKLRVGALQFLGRCFAAKNILDLAIKQLSEAVGMIAGMTDLKKEILYELADLQARAGDRTAAANTFKQIYEADISYRDVGQRIAALAN